MSLRTWWADTARALSPDCISKETVRAICFAEVLEKQASEERPLAVESNSMARLEELTRKRRALICRPSGQEKLKLVEETGTRGRRAAWGKK